MKLFGLIGFPLSHSFSKKYFTEKFVTENITGFAYENFPIENIDQLDGLVSGTEHLAGLNVTIPYKEKVIPYLDEMSPVVAAIHACNCIRIDNKRLKGYNTDVAGFSFILHRQLQPHHSKALILGTGGASKAVRYVLSEKNIEWKSVSRTKNEDNFSYSELTREIIREYPLIINTTPIGMYPNIDAAPEIPFAGIGGSHLCVDLIYNPEKTKFLQLSEDQGAAIQNGKDMLVVQAEESWKIWTSK